MGVSVLIVDDHPGFRVLARRLLEAEGYLVVGEAGDGGSAVTAAAALKPQLVLLDIQLPDRDGFEVTRQLLQQAPHCQVVLISSRAACDYGHQVDRSGARGFILKDELCGAALAGLLLVAE